MRISTILPWAGQRARRRPGARTRTGRGRRRGRGGGRGCPGSLAVDYTTLNFAKVRCELYLAAGCRGRGPAWASPWGLQCPGPGVPPPPPRPPPPRTPRCRTALPAAAAAAVAVALYSECWWWRRISTFPSLAPALSLAWRDLQWPVLSITLTVDNIYLDI